MRRWLFSVRAEQRLCEDDPQALSFFYWEAVQAVNRGHLTVGERLYELKALQEQTKKQEVGVGRPGSERTQSGQTGCHWLWVDRRERGGMRAPWWCSAGRGWY